MSTLTPEQPGQAPAAQQAPAPAAGGAEESVEAKLARMDKELREARTEAAKYRTTLRSQEQAQQEAEAAKLAEQGKYKELLEKEQTERAKLAAEVAKRDHEAAQRKAARDAGIDPDAWAGRLRGSTREELAADAASLAQSLMPAGAPQIGATNPGAQRGDKIAPFDPKNPPRLSSIAWKK